VPRERGCIASIAEGVFKRGERRLASVVAAAVGRGGCKVAESLFDGDCVLRFDGS